MNNIAVNALQMRDEWELTLREQQYKRLDHLLNRSKFYSQYLVDKIDQQTEQKLLQVMAVK